MWFKNPKIFILLGVLLITLQFCYYKIVKLKYNLKNRESEKDTRQKYIISPNGTFYDDKEDRKNKMKMDECFNRRQLRVKRYCSSHKNENLAKYDIIRHLLVDSGHNTAWCPIYKAGSTEWFKFFAVIGGELKWNAKLPDPNVQIYKLARKAFPYLGHKRVAQLLKTSIKFIVVRHPFERLLSAYRDKLQDPNNAYYHRAYGKYIAQWYGRNATATDAPSFEDFLAYVVAERIFDGHWKPYGVDCAPCYVRYDFILKMETFERDREYMMRYVFDDVQDVAGRMSKFRNENGRGRTRDRAVKAEYFSQISTELLERVYEIYEGDFAAFGYSAEEYFAMTRAKGR